MSNISIYRNEYDYADIKGIGITDDGNLIIVKKDEKTPEFSSSTRIINNTKVENAFTAPVKLFLDPTTKCPLSCPFCLSDSFANSNQLIEKEKINDIVQQTIETGILRVKIGGGEPFIYPYFLDIIEKLRKNGIFISCSTSGILISKMSVDELKFFADNKVKVSISIDGNEEYHDKLRHHDGLFKKAINATQRLKTSGVNVELRATIANDIASYNQVNFLNDLSLDMGIKMRIRTVKPKGRAVKNNYATLYPDEKYWNFFDNIRLKAQNNPLINIEEMLSFDNETGYSCYNCKLDCAAGTRSAYIDAKGNFCPCGFIEAHFPSEHLSENKTMKELWTNGNSFLKIRKFFKEQNENSSCSKCAFVNSCQGGCPSVRLSTGSDFDYRCPQKRKVS